MKVAWIAVSGPQPLKAEALARLEVIADTYLSMNAPIQLALFPRCWKSGTAFSAQLMQRRADNLAELDAQLAAQKLCRPAGGRRRMVCRVCGCR